MGQVNVAVTRPLRSHEPHARLLHGDQLDLRVCGYPLYSENRSLRHVQHLEERRVFEGGYDASRFRRLEARNGYGE